MNVEFSDIVAARARIASGIYASPCPESIPLSELCGSSIYCKLEYLQRTGSFKERGARNALLLLSAEQRARGVIAASAGNHALGLAYHGGLLNIPVTVVMPRFAPLIKATTCRRLGAKLIIHGERFSEAREHAFHLAQEEGLKYVHGFDDPEIIAGQGTIGLEILEQVPRAEAIVVPVGGGGLIAGVALAAKTLRPDILVVGVEPERAAGFSAALAAGKPVDVEVRSTLADGLAVGRVGERAWAVAAGRVDRLATVGEEQLSLAVLRLVELEKSVVEGAGAATLAACMTRQFPELVGRHVVLILSGGNIDLTMLGRVIDRGLVADGRLCRFTAVISDRPGGLAQLTEIIARAGGSVKDVFHDRAFSGPDVAAVNVVCTVEAADAAHIRRLYEAIRAAGIAVVHPHPAD